MVYFWVIDFFLNLGVVVEVFDVNNENLIVFFNGFVGSSGYVSCNWYYVLNWLE